LSRIDYWIIGTYQKLGREREPRGLAISNGWWLAWAIKGIEGKKALRTLRSLLHHHFSSLQVNGLAFKQAFLR
jgi:hypothetical protein